jgi:polysaccharide deacetylase 2 family uncharacterized protein YibQ
MNRKLLLILLVLVLVLGAVKLRTRDVRVEAFKAEEAVLGILQSHGASAGDILFREEDDWKKGRLKGKTLNYVIRLEKAVNTAALAEEIKERLKSIKGVSLSNVYYRSDVEKKKKTAYFEIKCRGSVILALTVENVIPDWMKGAPKAAKKLPAVALVLDDWGYTRKNLQILKDMETSFTIAVLPDAPHSKAVSSFAEKNGIEVILHLPMEPEKAEAQLEEETILAGMSSEDVKKILARDLETVSPAKGVSNHQGSKATKDERIMAIVLSEMKKKGLFFFDSLTTTGSVCERIAKKEGVLYAKRDLFLDEKADEEYIEGQMKKLERLARRQGYASAIGHERPQTLKVLREVIPEMKKRGIEFVALSVIVDKVNSEQ